MKRTASATASLVVLTLTLMLAGLLFGCSSDGDNVQGDTTPRQDVASDVIIGCSDNSDCEGDNPCLTGVCNASLECEFVAQTGALCDDGNACTADDACNADGVCVGAGTTECDDGNPCTTDDCEPGGGCVNEELADGDPCEDGSKCSEGDQCQEGVCVGGDQIACEDPSPDDCVYVACDPSTGACDKNELHPDGHPCLDGNPCTDGDACDGSGQCDSGEDHECTAQHPCKKAWCNEQAKEGTNPCILDWKQEGVGCNDGDACTDSDKCEAGDGDALECLGAPVDCDDGNSCTTDSCDEEVGCLFEDKTDGTPCSEDGTCQDGDCVCDADCGNKECGDDGCGGSCGECGNGYVCNDQGMCVEEVCQPECGGKECGDDGCGDVCGTCQNNEECQNGDCVCIPDCGGKECGDDGCGDTCGSCQGGMICENGGCKCPPGGCGPDVQWVQGADFPINDYAIPPSVHAVNGTDVHLFGGTKWANHVIYHTSSNTWTEKELVGFHVDEGAAGVINGQLYACGDGTFGAVEMYRYEAGNDEWTKLAGNPMPRRLPAYGVIGSKLYLAGGFAGAYNSKTNAYDAGGNSWSGAADVKPPGGTGVLSGTVYNGKLYVFGGNASPTDAMVYDPVANNWTNLEPIPAARYMGMVVTVGDEIWLMGGRQSNTAKDTLYIYYPGQDSWADVGTIPEALYGGRAAYVGGKVYIFAANKGSGAFSGKTWIGTVQ